MRNKTKHDGMRAKGRRANCSKETFILEGTPPLSPGVMLDTNQTYRPSRGVMAPHKFKKNNVRFSGVCLVIDDEFRQNTVKEVVIRRLL